MKKFRAILCVLLAISMVLVFAACGKSDDGAAETETKNGPTVVKEDATKTASSEKKDDAAKEETPAPAADELADVPADQQPDPNIESTALHMFSSVDDYLNRPHEIQAGSSVNLLATNDVPSYVPWNATAEVWLLPNIYEGLIWSYMGQVTDFRPLIAESYEHSDDYLTWTFQIREGVKFTDGTVCDANAIAQSWDYYYEASPASFNNINLVEWEATGDYEFVAKLSAPCAYFQNSCSRMYILSPTALGQYGINDNRSAIGTAPYYVADYTAGVEFILKANPDYYYYERMPVIETARYSIINDATTKLMAMINGDIDGYAFTSIESYYNLLDRGFDGQMLLSNGNCDPLFLNARSVPEFCSFEVRKAINRLIDFNAVNDLMYDGMGLVQRSLWSVGSSGEVPSDQFYYDFDEGKELLAQAGITELNFTAKIIDSSGDTFVTYQGMLAKAGVNMEVQPLEPEANFTFLMNGDWTITAGNSGYADSSPYGPWTFILLPEHLIRECWQSEYDPELYEEMCNEFNLMQSSSSWDEMLEHCHNLTRMEQDDFGAMPGIQAPFFAAFKNEIRNIVYVTENHSLMLYYMYLAD